MARKRKTCYIVTSTINGTRERVRSFGTNHAAAVQYVNDNIERDGSLAVETAKASY